MKKAEQFRQKFGNSSGNSEELDQIYAEIEKIGDRCKNLIWHTPLSYDTLKQLRKEGFTIDQEGGYYIIKW